MNQRTRTFPSIVQAYGELGETGARLGAQRGDVVVIIDALRASTTILTALQCGAQRVIPVLTVEKALTFLDDTTCLVAGERGGAKVQGFDFGNSPSELLTHRAEIEGKILVLTTSNGTRCVQAALTAPVVLVGSPLNATACAQCAWKLASQHQCNVTLVAAGLGGQPTEEDTFGQQLIAAKLRAQGAISDLPPVDEADSETVFINSPPAELLIGLGYKADIHLCAQIDLWSVVPLYQEGAFVAVTPDGCV